MDVQYFSHWAIGISRNIVCANCRHRHAVTGRTLEPCAACECPAWTRERSA